MSWRTRERVRRENAFTLIEVLVSIALLALMTTMLWFSFTNAFLAIDETGRDADVVRQARQVMNRLGKEVSMAYLSRHQVNLAGGLQDINQIQFGFLGTEEGDGDKLSFTSVANTKLYQDFNESDQAEISYYLEPDPRSKRRLNKLMRRVDVTLDDDFEEGGKVYPIAYNVKELRFRYYDKNKDEWYEVWDTARSETANRLPWAVEIVLVMEDPDKEERVFVSRQRLRMSDPQEPR